MIRSAATFVAMSLLATSAHAATVWQGEAVIDTATAACNTIPSAAIKPDSVLKTVIKPNGLPGNDADTSISFVANGIAMFALKLPGGALGAGTGFASGHTSSGVIKANVGTPHSAFTASPINAGVETITLSGKIENFLFAANCDVTFRAAYGKRD